MSCAHKSFTITHYHFPERFCFSWCHTCGAIKRDKEDNEWQIPECHRVITGEGADGYPEEHDVQGLHVR